MKKILLIILAGLLITVAILFIRPSKSLDQNLVLAEELMSDRPDSALKVLEKLKLENFSGENKALYALLMTQAQFKNYNFPESDSLIKIAYNYYMPRKDSLRKAQTYLYSGRVDENLGRKNEVLNNFQKASLAALSIKDYNLLVLIYCRWGIFFMKTNLINDALPMFEKSLEFSKLDKDTIMQIYNMKEIGNAYTLSNKFDMALKYYKQALFLAQFKGIEMYIYSIYKNLSILYKLKKEYDISMFYFKKSIPLNSDSTNVYSSYFLKGELLMLQHKYDSARYYLNLGKRNNLVSNATYCTLMSKLEETLGNFEKALKYSNDYIMYADSFENQSRRSEIAELQKKYDYSLIKNENTKLELEKENRNVFILIALIVFILAIWFITIHYNKVRREKDQVIKAGKEQLQQMADALIEWEMRLEEIQLKSKSDLDAFVKWVFSKNEAMIKIERLANMGTAERIANKDEMRLTPSEIANLKDVVDICFNKYVTRLSKQFPSLTEENIQHCCLLKMKIPASSIAILLGVSDSSLVKRKYRLKKEISGLVQGCVSLEDFLLKF